MSEIIMSDALCPICESPNTKIPSPNTRTFDVHCEKCGNFQVTLEAFHTKILQNLTDDERVKYSLNIRKEYDAGKAIRLTPDNVGDFRS
jgi:hypothetical protein